MEEDTRRIRWIVRTVTVFGLTAIAVSVAINEWVVAAYVSADGLLSPLSKNVIRVFEALLMIAGALSIWFRAAITQRMTRKNAAIVLVAGIIGLLVLELGSFLTLRYVLRVPVEVRGRIGDRALHIFTEGVSGLPFGTKKNFRQELNSEEFRTNIQLNNIGAREDRDYHGEPIDLGFVGDSFMFGFGVNVGERISDLIRTYYPNATTLSFGFLDGLAPPHYALFFRQHPEYVPETMVMGLYPFNDLDLDIRDTELVRDQRGNIVGARLTIRYLTESGAFGVRQAYESDGVHQFTKLLNTTYTGKLMYVAWQRGVNLYNKSLDPHMASVWTSKPVGIDEKASFQAGTFDQEALISLQHIEELRRYVEARGKRFIVLMIPTPAHVNGGSYPQWKPLKQWFVEQRIETVDLLPEFVRRSRQGPALYFTHDEHWTIAGHKAAAEVLIDFLHANPRNTKASRGR